MDMSRFLQRNHMRDVGEAVLEASKEKLVVPVVFTHGFLCGSFFYSRFCEKFDDIWEPHVWPGNKDQCAFLERHFVRKQGTSIWHQGYKTYYAARKLADAHVTRFGILMGVCEVAKEAEKYQ